MKNESITISRLREMLNEGRVARMWFSEGPYTRIEVALDGMYSLRKFKDNEIQSRTTYRRIRALVDIMSEYAPLEDWSYVYSIQAETGNLNHLVNQIGQDKTHVDESPESAIPTGWQAGSDDMQWFADTLNEIEENE